MSVLSGLLFVEGEFFPVEVNVTVLMLQRLTGGRRLFGKKSVTLRRVCGRPFGLLFVPPSWRIGRRLSARTDDRDAFAVIK